jgi:tetratricopeptide (TPR) repeat protein
VAALSISYERVGYALEAQGKLDEGLNAYRHVVLIRERLAAADPRNTALQRDLAAAYERASSVLVAQGKLVEAFAVYRESLAVRRRLVTHDLSNVPLQNELQFTIEQIGSLSFRFALIRDFARALEAADQAISLVPDKTWLYGNRAHALMFQNREQEARALYLQYSGEKKVLEAKSWESLIVEDFTELLKRGLAHPLMDEIEKRFAPRG